MKTYAELIEHLLSKSSDIIPIELDFEGKNVMLFYPGAFAIRGAHDSSDTIASDEVNKPYSDDATTLATSTGASNNLHISSQRVLRGDVYMKRALFGRGVATADVWNRLSGNEQMK